MSQGKAFGSSFSQAQQRVKYFKFYSEAKLFLKFSWQPASLVIRRFDVCFKNLAQTDKLWARNPNKQSEKPRAIPGKLSLYHQCGPSIYGGLHQSAVLLWRCDVDLCVLCVLLSDLKMCLSHRVTTVCNTLHLNHNLRKENDQVFLWAVRVRMLYTVCMYRHHCGV